jgi:threonine dehydrogenase-like Zn-dependent dehydrogenase
LPEANLLEVPDAVSDNAAVFVEPLAAANGIAELVEINPDTQVAVIGDGKLGILCARTLSRRTSDLTLVGKHEEKLERASKYGNITGMLLQDAEKMNRRFNIVVEASGSESGFATALNLVRPRGKVVLKSTFQGAPTWNATKVVVDEISVVGSRCGRFAPALELLENGQVQVEDLISEEFPLADGIAAMKKAAERGVLKVLLVP